MKRRKQEDEIKEEKKKIELKMKSGKDGSNQTLPVSYP